MSSSPVGPDAITKALGQLKNSTDPTYFLLQKDMETTMSMYGLQNATAEASEGVSNIAYANVSAGNALLQQDMEAVTAASSGADIQKKSTTYGYDSTKVNNNNNNFSNITQTGMTGVTDLTRQESNAMDSASAVIDNISGITSLLSGWGS